MAGRRTATTSTAPDVSCSANLQIENDFGPFRLKSTTGYRVWHNDSATDLDGIGAFTGPQFTNATLFNGMPAPLLRGLGLPAATAGYLAGQPVPQVGQNLFDTNNRRRHRQFSEEIEISGRIDHLDWVVGGFYF